MHARTVQLPYPPSLQVLHHHGMSSGPWIALTSELANGIPPPASDLVSCDRSSARRTRSGRAISSLVDPSRRAQGAQGMNIRSRRRPARQAATRYSRACFRVVSYRRRLLTCAAHAWRPACVSADFQPAPHRARPQSTRQQSLLPVATQGHVAHLIAADGSYSSHLVHVVRSGQLGAEIQQYEPKCQ